MVAIVSVMVCEVVIGVTGADGVKDAVAPAGSPVAENNMGFV